MKTMLKMFLAAMAFILLSDNRLNAQQWKESTGMEWNFDLSGLRILTIIYEGFNYEEAIEISDQWKKWGAQVDLAGTLPEQHGERNNPATGKVHDEVPVTITPALLLKDIDHSNYDLVYFPGGEGVKEFLPEYRDRLREIIDGTVESGRYVAAICHAPYLLSASELLNGRRVTVQGGEFKPELIKSGAKIVSEVFVNDGNFLTGMWPYFETFAVSVAEALDSRESGCPVHKSGQDLSPTLKALLAQRNVFMMQPGTIPDDTLSLMIRCAINPILPFQMMNNSTTRFVAVKDSAVKSALIEKIMECSMDRYKAEKISPEAMKAAWTRIFSPPAVVFVFSDESQAASLENPADKENFTTMATALAGQAVAQLGIAARELGYGISVFGNLRSLLAKEGLVSALDVPGSYRLVNIVGIGHPVESMGPAVARPVSEYLEIR